MTLRCLQIAAAITLGATLAPAFAQMAAPAPLPAASAASAASAAPEAKPGPRALSPSELRDSASTPGDLRPEDRVKPQISIGLGKGPATPLKLIPPSGTPAASGGINDASVRCEAETDVQARAACRKRLASTAPAR